MKKYVYTFIIVFIGYFIIESIYVQINKDQTPGKAKRLECQKKVVTFEKGFDNKHIYAAQKEIESGHNQFTSYIEKAIYSQSTLFEYITVNDTDKILQNEFDLYFKKKDLGTQNYNYSYLIYENDKKDPGKKSKKSKLFAGYIVFEVKNSKNKSIYKVQIDFMDNKGKDIASTMKCSVKSFMTYSK